MSAPMFWWVSPQQEHTPWGGFANILFGAICMSKVSSRSNNGHTTDDTLHNT